MVYQGSFEVFQAAELHSQICIKKSDTTYSLEIGFEVVRLEVEETD